MPKKKAGKPEKPPPAPKKPKRAKSDALEVAKRVEEVLRIRLDGAQFHDLREYAVEKEWGVSDTQLRRYQQRADELLIARHEDDRPALIARHAAQRAMLFARSVNAADYRTALSVLADEARLRGLYPADKSEVKMEGVVKEFVVVTVPSPAAGCPPGSAPAPGTG